MSSIPSSRILKSKFGVVPACLLMIWLSAVAALQPVTADRDGFGAGSHNPEVSSLTNSGPTVLVAGKRVRSLGFESLFDALNGQHFLFFDRASYLFLSSDSAEIHPITELPAIPIRAPPGSHV